MRTSVRLATAGDIDALSSLTSAGRGRLAEWSPTWWRGSTSADELHPLWLAHLIQSDGPVVRVVEDDGAIIGCCVSMPQAGQWFVDDLAVVADNRWPDAGALLLQGVVERPALTCVPVADRARAAALRAAGLRHVSSYWIGPTEARSPIDANRVAAAATATQPPPPISPATDLPEPPLHTFGGRLDPGTEGALAFTHPGAGLVVGSPSTPAPPVFDPGGTVCVIDRIIGADRAGLLHMAIDRALHRGDVLVAVVAAVDDLDLQPLLRDAGLEQTVDVFSWA